MHLDRTQQRTGDMYLSKITNLDIEDVYQYNAPALINILRCKLEDALEYSLVKN